MTVHIVEFTRFLTSCRDFYMFVVIKVIFFMRPHDDHLFESKQIPLLTSHANNITKEDKAINYEDIKTY